MSFKELIPGHDLGYFWRCQTVFKDKRSSESFKDNANISFRRIIFRLKTNQLNWKKLNIEFLTFLFPTRIIGTFGQKCLTSGVHFSGMFSRESGESMLKHIRMTSVSG